MSIETRVRQTGQIGGAGGGGSSTSSGLAGLNQLYVVTSASPQLTGSRILTAGSSVTIVTDATSVYITALTPGAAASSAGLAGTGMFYLMTSGQTGWPNVAVYSSALIGYRDLPVQSAKLYASTSAARIDAGTSVWRLLYSATTQQFGIWQFILPRDYSSSPFLRILHGNDSSLSVAKTTSWIVDQWGFNPGNALAIYNDTFGGTNTTSIALSAGYSAGLLQTITVPLATVVSMNVGNLIRLRVSGSNGAAGNTELFGLNFEYTRI